MSPDGARLAFSSNRSGAREIWVADVSGDHAAQLTTFGGPVPGTARWSPDQQQVAFDARPEGNSDIYVVPAGGGADPPADHGPRRGRAAGLGAATADRSISPRTGPAAARSGGCRSTAGRRSRSPRRAPPTSRSSRDGQWIFYQGLTPPLAIHRARPDGSDDTVVVAEDVRIGMFAPTERGLWFVTNPVPGKPAVTLKRLDFADGTIRDVATVDFVPIPVGLSVSADERYALITRNDRNGSDLLLVNDFR